MSYSIIRMQKMKSPAIKGIQFHNQRERESETNPDINKSISYLNYDLIHHQSKIDYNEKIDQVIQENVTPGKTIRKDAVKLAEFLITSDKEFFDGISPKDQKRYFQNAYEFLADRYGKQNLIYATVHYDEKTPHMHVGFVPVTEDGRLSAKDFFGQKKQLVSLQDDFNAHIKKHGFNLERGVSSSRKHLETAKFKALTLQERQKEAHEDYERTISRIEQISESTKPIESIESKKVLGLVGMKEQDYNSLVDYAMNGVVYQVKNDELQEELKKAQNEISKLKEDMQIGNDKIRHYYKDVEVNLETLATEKAIERFDRIDMVQRYRQIAEKHNNLVKRYNSKIDENRVLEQDLGTQIRNLEYRLDGYKKENLELKNENDKLKNMLHSIKKEFSNLTERFANVLSDQIERIKSILHVKGVDRSKTEFLDHRHMELVQDSLKGLDKVPKEKQRDMGMHR